MRSTAVLMFLTAFSLLFQAYNAGDRIHRYLRGVRPGVMLEQISVAGMLEGEVESRVEKMAAAINRAPRNARYDRNTNTIIGEMSGLLVDVRETVRMVMAASPDTKVKLALVKLEPELTAKIFNSIKKKLSIFSTSGGGDGGRADNLYVAAKYINGTILAPGDVFSFNKATGPRTLARGYSIGPVVGGMGIGGGVCQVATTVYNAAQLADMEIIERHPHSVNISYVPPGRDATVTNYLDFKFRNSTNKFIQIRSGAGGGYTWVQIWSQALDK